MTSLPPATGTCQGDPAANREDLLTRFRQDFYQCLPVRADALFELTDAVLCSAGPVGSLAELSLEPEHRRGHGGLYDGINAGRIEFARLKFTLARLTIPKIGGRIVLAVDVSAWMRPDAQTSPDRLFCHKHGRAKDTSQMIPGWPYSIVAALAPGPTSWTTVLDAIRLGPGDDATAVTASQLREVVDHLITAGHWHPGDPNIKIVMDSGYDVTRLAHVPADLPVTLIARLRTDRVMLRPTPPHPTPPHTPRTLRRWRAERPDPA